MSVQQHIIPNCSFEHLIVMILQPHRVSLSLLGAINKYLSTRTNSKWEWHTARLFYFFFFIRVVLQINRAIEVGIKLHTHAESRGEEI